jgi:hypothetical protein
MKRRPRLTVFTALAGILFLQAVIALAPCGLGSRAAATAQAAAMASMPECNLADVASLGLAHCAAEDQALISAHLELPELAPPVARPATVTPRRLPVVVAIPRHLATAGPPPRILFQSFLL